MIAVVAGSRVNSSMRRAWRATGPVRRDAGERGRRAQQGETVAGGRRVHDREVEHRAAGAALELREVPDLAHRHELAHPGAAAVSSWKMRLPPSRPASVPDLSWWRSHSSMARRGGSTGRRGPAPARPPVARAPSHAEHRGQALLLGHLDHHRALARPRRRQAERGRDRGLSGAALAHHEHQPLVEEHGHSLQRFCLPAHGAGAHPTAVRPPRRCHRAREGHPRPARPLRPARRPRAATDEPRRLGTRARLADRHGDLPATPPSSARPCSPGRESTPARRPRCSSCSALPASRASRATARS